MSEAVVFTSSSCWGVRWSEKALKNRPKLNVLPESNDAFDYVISLTAPAWVSVTEMFLSILTHMRIG